MKYYLILLLVVCTHRITYGAQKAQKKTASSRANAAKTYIHRDSLITIRSKPIQLSDGRWISVPMAPVFKPIKKIPASFPASPIKSKL